MKEKLSAFFKIMRKGKNRRIGFILTIVALVEAIAIMVVSTSAWVESISSIKIFTTYSSTNTSGTKGIVESLKKQRTNLVESGTDLDTDIDLTDYFRQSGGYHLAGASSVDGKTMYFPEIKGGNTTNYRIGNVNDKNVNYISFTVKTTSAVHLAFDAVPAIKFDGTDIEDSSYSAESGLTYDTRKLVRFSIGDNAENYRVYSLYPDEFTESVPASDTVNNSTHAGYADSIIYPFSDFVKGINKAVDTTANGFLSFNMWIQDPEGTYSEIYHNKALTVTGLKLVTVTPFTLKTAYTNDSGEYVIGTRAANPGGTVAIGDGIYGYEVVAYVRIGSVISLKAAASESNGYVFAGWITSGTSPAGSTSPTVGNSSNPYSYTVTAANQTFYALFTNVHNIFMRPDYKHKGNNNTVRFAAFVFGVNSSGVTEGKWYNMSKTTGSDATNWPNYYKCTYRGNATSIIFCYMDKNNTTNDWPNRWLQTYDLTVPSRPGEYGYIVTCRQYYSSTNSIDRNDTGIDEDNGYGTNKLLGYWTHSYVKVQLGTTTNSSTLLSNTSYGDYYPALIDTSRTGGYAWWYNDDNTNHRVYVDGKAYQDIDSNGDIIPQYKYDKAVMLTAKDNSYYLFKGWYTDAAGTTPVSNITYNGTTYTYTNHDFPIIASNNNNYSGTNTVKTDNYYAKFEERPATWQIKYGSSATGDWPGVVTMTNSSGSTFTGSLTLTHGQEIWLKIYDFKNSKWYGNGGDYADYIKTTLVSNSTLSTSGGNIHLKSAFDGNATFNFSFNSSTKQLTITQSGTVPNVTLWNNTSDGGTGNHITMTRSSTNSNVMTCTKDISEGGNIYFKINDQSSSVWYTNATAYNEYTKKSIIDSAVMSTSGNNMRIHGHAGTYTFSFDYVTKKLSVSAAYSDIDITLDSTKVSSWIGDGSAKIYYVSTNDEDGLHWEQMTASNSNKTYTVSVPSNYANNTQFLRRNSDNNTTWNYWPASETYRGFNKKFTISSSDGNNHSGSWGN